MWLAMQERCWTADRLARHGLTNDDVCALCDQEPETMQHLLAGCSFSRQVWHEVLGWVRAPANLPDGATPFLAWWQASSDQAPAPARKGLASIIILTAWWIWKHRNGCTFDHDRPSVSHLITNIKEEARLWAKAGATGIKNIIPES